jgi:predicted nucleic acid-binding protein
VIVVDASTALWALMGTPDQAALARAALGADPDWHAPGVFQFEVVQRLRAVTLGTDRPRRTRAEAAAANFATWVVQPVDSGPLVGRAWELRHNVDAGDALYVAAAEWLGCPLLTVDGPLIKASGPRCGFRVVG